MLDETEIRGQCDIGENTRPSYSRMQISPSIVLICPDEAHRRMLLRALEAQHASVLNTLTVYPSYNNLLAIVDLDCDAFLIDLDTDSDNALDLVETLCSRKP